MPCQLVMNISLIELETEVEVWRQNKGIRNQNKPELQVTDHCKILTRILRLSGRNYRTWINPLLQEKKTGIFGSERSLRSADVVGGWVSQSLLCSKALLKGS